MGSAATGQCKVTDAEHSGRGQSCLKSVELCCSTGPQWNLALELHGTQSHQQGCQSKEVLHKFAIVVGETDKTADLSAEPTWAATLRVLLQFHDQR